MARLRKPEAAPSAAPGGDPAAAGARFEVVPDERLRAEGVDPDLLPGPVGVFNGSLHVRPRSALARLPAGLRWQGLYVGKIARNGDLHLSPRLRLDGPGPVAELEGRSGVDTLLALIQGRSVTASDWVPAATARGSKHVLLRWNGLNLGRATLKHTRLLWSER